MAKLYPPYLDSTVPAFYSYNEYNAGGDAMRVTSLRIPFSLNKTVGKSDIHGFAVKLRTLQSDTLIWSSKTMDPNNFDVTTEFQVTFNIPDSIKLTVGQFYKIQLAFIDETQTIGYYSTTAVVKYTTKPIVSISGLASAKVNSHLYSYTGLYSQNAGDATEKMYSCRFLLTDSHNQIISDSGEMIHHSYNDESNRESHETFVIPEELTANQSYYLTFSVTTNNKMTVHSPQYRIIKAGTVMPDMDVTLSANLNQEEGFVELILHNNQTDAGGKAERKVTGMFYIMRAASNEGYAWREMGNFILQAQIPSRQLWKDYTIEQGVTYIYAIQQYNSVGLRSDRIEAAPLIADFEDAFLYDGQRQLKIKYNPKVSSFKRNTIEQKTDTIGSKYPFIFRNGNISYHEFPISGLISYLADNNQQFLSLSDLNIEARATNLTTENIAAERLFKMEVLKWLTNGEPKLFKSPGEGNFIVRLMNVSLAPIDTLGRMLHSFNCTAYEVADYTYESLQEKGFVRMENDVVQTRMQSINIAGHSTEIDSIADSIMSYYELKVNIPLSEENYWRIMNSTYYEQTPEGPVQMPLDISDCVTELGVLVLSPGNSLIGVKSLRPEKALAISALKNKITYAGGQLNTKRAYTVDIREALPGTIFLLDKAEITIGQSGSYYVELPDGIEKIVLPQDQPNLINPMTGEKIHPVGVVTYSYHSDMSNVFDLYHSATVEDYPAKMWFGTPSCRRYNPYKSLYETSNNLLDCIQDVKTTIAQIFSVKFSPRPVMPIFLKDEKYYKDMDCETEITLDELNPIYVYQICNPRSDYKYDDYNYTRYFIDANYRQGYYVSEGQDVPYTTNTMIDGNTKKKFILANDFYDVVIDDETIRLEEHEYSLNTADFKPTSITFGKGICCEMSYQVKIMTFSSELNTHEVPKAYRDIYDARYARWLSLREEFLDLSNEDIINKTQAYTELVQKYEEMPKLIEQDYETLLTYVAVAKKDFEEEMKS